MEPRGAAISGQCGGEGDGFYASLPVLSPVYMFNDKVSEEDVKAILAETPWHAARSGA